MKRTVNKRHKKTKAVIGIDPGKSGCACLLTEEGKFLFMDWPKDDDLFFVHATFIQWTIDFDIVGCLLEKVGAMPKQGVKSMFTFGTNNGYWMGLLCFLKLSYHRPTPKQWQTGLVTKGDGADPKARAYTVAKRLYPHAELKGPKGGIKDGRVDALLLAHKAKDYF